MMMNDKNRKMRVCRYRLPMIACLLCSIMVNAEDRVAPAPFGDRMGVAPVNGGFAMDDSWVWGGSVIRGEDGRYHMFASRWPKSLAFAPGIDVSGCELS